MEPPPLPNRPLQYQSMPVYVRPPENTTVTGIATALGAFAVIMLVGLALIVLFCAGVLVVMAARFHG